MAKHKLYLVNLVLVVVLLASSVFTTVAQAAVGTDQGDYAPGSVVTIAGDNSDGAGYLPGETVHVAVSGPNGYASACDGLADEAGAWSCQVTLWDSTLAVGDYAYTATGELSGVSQSGVFRDAVNINLKGNDGNPHATDKNIENLGTVFQGALKTASIGLKATGVGSSTVTWTINFAAGYKDNANLSPRTILSPNNGTFTSSSDYVNVIISIDTSTLLPGIYSGKLEGKVSTGSTDFYYFTFTVLPPCSAPHIITDPVSLVQTVGGEASFSVNASGTNLTYQWLKGIESIAGGTSSTYSIQAVQIADEGEYRVVVSNACGQVTSEWATLTVNRVTPLITWTNPAAIVYGTPLGDTQLNAIVDQTGALAYTPPAGTVLNAGSGQVLSVAFTPASPDVAAASATVTIDVLPADQAITLNLPAAMTYGDAPFTVEASATSGLPVELAASGACTISGSTLSLTGAGTCTVTASQPGNGNYNPALAVTKSFPVSQAAATITAVGNTCVYDGSPCEGSGSASGVLGEDLPVSIRYTPGESAPVNAGAYRMTVTFEGNDNYLAGSAQADVTVQPATPIIEVTGGAFTYDGEVHAASAVAKGAGGATVAGTFTFTYNTLADQPVNANVYEVIATFTSSDSNYTDAVGTGTITITKAAPTITITGGPFTYDGSPFEATVHALGVDGNAVAGDLAVTYNGSADLPVNAGAYTVHVTFTSSDANYTDATADGEVVINKALSVTTITGGGEFVYDGLAHAASVIVTGAGGLYLTPAPVYNCAQAPVNVAETPCEASYTYPGDLNHEPSSGTAVITITQRPITVTAEEKAKVYGDADPALTYTYPDGDLVAGDVFTGALARVSGENVGQYAIQQGTLALSSNYQMTFVEGLLTIHRRPITVTADAQSKVYGEADPALTYQITSGNLVFEDAFSGALAREAGENVGEYAITQGALALSDNYDLAFTGAKLTISPRPVTVTAQPQIKVYGDDDPTLTYEITSGNLVGSDGFAGGLIREPGENVGPYAILQGSLTLGTNYTLTFMGNTLTITQRPITVTADEKSKVYGDADPALTYQVTSGSLAFSDAFTGSLARAGGEDIGKYTIGQGSLALSENYKLTYVSADLTITRRPITVTADPQIKVLNGQEPALTYQITSGNLVFADTFSGSLARVPGEAIGSYAINQGTLALSSNYALSFVGNILKIVYAPASACPGSQQVLQPINADGSSVFKKGSTVPVKFRVCDANGVSVGTPGVVDHFWLVRTQNGTAVSLPNETPISTTPDTTFRWSPTDQQWIFNLNTKNLTPGYTYTYHIFLNDGNIIEFKFGLK